MAARVFTHLSSCPTWLLGPDWPMPAWLRSAALELQLQTDAAASGSQPPSVPPFMQPAVALLVHDMYLATLGTHCQENTQRALCVLCVGFKSVCVVYLMHTAACCIGTTHACMTMLSIHRAQPKHPPHSLPWPAHTLAARAPRREGPAGPCGPPHGPRRLLAPTHRRRHALGGTRPRRPMAALQLARGRHIHAAQRGLLPHAVPVAHCLRRGNPNAALCARPRRCRGRCSSRSRISSSRSSAPVCDAGEGGHLTPPAASTPQRACSEARHHAGRRHGAE